MRSLSQRAAACPDRVWLALLVASSLLAHIPALVAQRTIAYLPDEYIYSSLGRSLAERGELLVRGGHQGLNAVLLPLLQAPLWKLGDLFQSPELGFRLCQVESTLFFSLAVVPAYLLGRSVGLRRSYALGAAALILALPEAAYGSLLLSEPLALPLLLTVIWAAVRVLEAPERRSNRVVLGFAFAFAAGCRVQFFALPVLYLTLVCGYMLAQPFRRRLLWRAHRSYAAVIAAALLLAVVIGPGGTLGMYAHSDSLPLGPLRHPVDFAFWAALDLAVGLLGAGVVLAPGALLAARAALKTPRREAERALVYLAALVGIYGLGIAAMYALGGYGNVETRYSFYPAALVPILFACWLERGAPGVRKAALLLLAVAVYIGVFQLAHVDSAAAGAGSAELFALHAFDARLYGYAVGMADRQVLLGLLLVTAFALACLRYRRPILLGLLALAVMLPLQAGATSYIHLTRPQPWLLYESSGVQVDRQQTTGVALELPGANKIDMLESGFLYRQLDMVYMLPGAKATGGVPTWELRIGRNGSLHTTLGNSIPAGNLLVFDGAATAVLATPIRVLGRSAVATLYASPRMPRLALLVSGDRRGALAATGTIRVWANGDARLSGWLHFQLRGLTANSTLTKTAPAPTHLRFRLPDGTTRSLTFGSTAWQQVRLPICAASGTTVRFDGRGSTLRGSSLAGALTSARLRALGFTPDAAACG